MNKKPQDMSMKDLIARLKKRRAQLGNSSLLFAVGYVFCVWSVINLVLWMCLSGKADSPTLVQMVITQFEFIKNLRIY